jgi:Trypsin-like peptidase domain
MIIAIWLSCLCQQQPTPVPGFDPRPAIAAIYARSRGRLVTTKGTGFFIGDHGVLATAYHVVRGAEQIDIYVSNRHYTAGILDIAADKDIATLALLDIGGDSLPFLVIDSRKTWDALHDNPVIVGWPRGAFQDVISAHFTADTSLDAGAVAKYARFNNLFTDHRMKLTTFRARIDHGVSGAPLLREGKVLAIVSGSADTLESDALNWGIPVVYLPMTHLDRPASAVAPGKAYAWPQATFLAPEGRWGPLTARYEVDTTAERRFRSAASVLEEYRLLVGQAPTLLEPYRAALGSLDSVMAKMLTISSDTGRSAQTSLTRAVLVHQRLPIALGAFAKIIRSIQPTLDSLIQWHDSAGTVGNTIGWEVDSLLDADAWTPVEATVVASLKAAYLHNKAEREGFYGLIEAVRDSQGIFLPPSALASESSFSQVVDKVPSVRNWIALELRRSAFVTGEAFTKNTLAGLQLLQALEEYVVYRDPSSN